MKTDNSALFKLRNIVRRKFTLNKHGVVFDKTLFRSYHALFSQRPSHQFPTLFIEIAVKNFYLAQDIYAKLKNNADITEDVFNPKIYNYQLLYALGLSGSSENIAKVHIETIAIQKRQRSRFGLLGAIQHRYQHGPDQYTETRYTQCEHTCKALHEWHLRGLSESTFQKHIDSPSEYKQIFTNYISYPFDPTTLLMEADYPEKRTPFSIPIRIKYTLKEIYNVETSEAALEHLFQQQTVLGHNEKIHLLKMVVHQVILDGELKMLHRILIHAFEDHRFNPNTLALSDHPLYQNTHQARLLGITTSKYANTISPVIIYAAAHANNPKLCKQARLIFGKTKTLKLESNIALFYALGGHIPALINQLLAIKNNPNYRLIQAEGLDAYPKNQIEHFISTIIIGTLRQTGQFLSRWIRIAIISFFSPDFRSELKGILPIDEDYWVKIYDDITYRPGPLTNYYCAIKIQSIDFRAAKKVAMQRKKMLGLTTIELRHYIKTTYDIQFKFTGLAFLVLFLNTRSNRPVSLVSNTVTLTQPEEILTLRPIQTPPTTHLHQLFSRCFSTTRVHNRQHSAQCTGNVKEVMQNKYLAAYIWTFISTQSLQTIIDLAAKGVFTHSGAENELSLSATPGRFSFLP